MHGTIAERAMRIARTPLEIVRLGALVGVLSAPLAHGKVEAAHIAPSATWTEGKLELKRSAEQDEDELGIIVVIKRDETAQWLPVVEGVKNKVPPEKADEVVTSHGPVENAERGCSFHTHPDKVVEKEFSIQKTDWYAPPSISDIIWSEVEFGENLLRKAGVPEGRGTEAVVDSRGTWYFRFARETDGEAAAEYARRLETERWLTRDLRNFAEEVRGWTSEASDDVFENASQFLSDADKMKLKQISAMPADQQRREKEGLFVEALLLAPGQNTQINQLAETLVRADFSMRYADMQKSLEAREKNWIGIELALDAASDQFNLFTERQVDPNFDFKKEYKILWEKYLATGVILRFVPHEKDTEPCSGVPAGYRPENDD